MIKLMKSLLAGREDEIFFEPSIDSCPEAVTVRKFLQDIGRSCGFWKQYFAGPNHHVGILAENSYEWIVQWLGIIASGNIMVALNYNLSEGELIDCIKRADVEAVLCDENFFEDALLYQSKIGVSFLNLSESFGECADSVERKDSDVVVMLFSSGTGGKSKIVELTDKNFCCYELFLETKPEFKNTVLISLPFFHVGGACLFYKELVLGSNFMVGTAKNTIRDIQSGKATYVCFTPAMLRLFMNQLEKGIIDPDKIKNLRTILSVSAPLSAAEYEKVKKCGLKLINGYGMTETLGGVSYGEPTEDGKLGIPCPFVKIRIIDGEIVLSGDCVMKGYYKQPEETAKILRDGWLDTGDLGRIGEDGCLYVSGRKKNLIILSNGENISPEELEEKLYQCPFVTECCVFGEDDKVNAKIYTEKADEGFEEREKAIRSWIKTLNKELPVTHRIREAEITEQPLEKTALGKIKR